LLENQAKFLKFSIFVKMNRRSCQLLEKKEKNDIFFYSKWYHCR